MSLSSIARHVVLIQSILDIPQSCVCLGPVSRTCVCVCVWERRGTHVSCKEGAITRWFFTPFGFPPPPTTTTVNDNNYLGGTLIVVGVEEPSATSYKRGKRSSLSFSWTRSAGLHYVSTTDLYETCRFREYIAALHRSRRIVGRVISKGRQNPPVVGTPECIVTVAEVGGHRLRWW